MFETRAEGYRGPERRKRQLYVTRNTEYFVEDQICVAVRDRDTDVWLEGHLALGRPLSGSVRVLASGALAPSPRRPRVGEALFFADHGPELITSTLLRVDRPTEEHLDTLPG